MRKTLNGGFPWPLGAVNVPDTMSAAPAAERIVPQPTPTLADSTLPTIKFIPVPDRSPVFDPSLSHTLDRFLLLELLYALDRKSVL